MLRLIYFSVVSWRKIYPLTEKVSDQTMFETNRYLFMADHPDHPLREYEFSDWKYYLHYGLTKNEEMLMEAIRKWPYTGRLVAEWIHTKRTKLSSLEMLKIWREKIEEVPKSGELWCEGGRIYAELREYENASKCFRTAIHFTPQYGDSFVEELKILLLRGRFLDVERLKKVLIGRCR